MTMALGRNKTKTAVTSSAAISKKGVSQPVAIYYVDPNGSDTNSGTSPSTPWQTLSKVNGATIPAGAWVLFKGGATFTGTLSLVEGQHYGNSGAITVFGSYGTGRATIQASGNSDRGAYLVNPHHVTVQDLIFVGTGTTVSTASGVYCSNDLLSNSKLKGLTLLRLDVSGYGYDGIALYTGDTAYAANSASGWDAPLIDSCIVHDCTGNCIDYLGNGLTIQGLYGLVANAASHTNPVVRNCKVYNCTGKTGITVSHCGSGIILGQCNNALIEFCEAYNNGANNTFASGPVGIWFYECTNSVIQYCESHHNKTGVGTSDGGGFDIDGGCQNCIVQFCYSHDNYGSGYQLYQFNDSTVLALTGNTIRFNISENDGTQAPTAKGGILIGTAEASRAAPGNSIYNNTIYSSVASINGVYVYSNPDKFTTTYFCNNIFYLTGATTKLINSSTSLTPAIRFIGNLYSTVASVSIKWGASTYTSIGAWRGAFSTQETITSTNVSVSGDPLLQGTVPVGNTNGFSIAALAPYKLQSSSPAKNAGQNINSLFSINLGSIDLFGNALSAGGTANIGCYEAP
jgi:hypothetical protein